MDKGLRRQKKIRSSLVNYFNERFKWLNYLSYEFGKIFDNNEIISGRKTKTESDINGY